jgi:rubrerythrin
MNVYEENEAKPGLPIFPSDEKGLIDKNTRKADNHVACKNCGYVKESKDNFQSCPVCQQQEWMEAIF